MPLVLDGTTGFSLPLGAEIGVGTDTPAGNGLHVDHTAGATLRLTRLGTSTSHFVQLETDGAHGTLRSEGNFTLQSGGANPRITVLSTGKVGIGTTNPQSMLHIETSASDFVRLTSATGNNDVGIDFFKSTTRMWNIRNNGNNDYLYITPASITDADAVVAIKPDGDVGIGTISPADKMHIYNSSGTTVYKAEVNANSTVGFGILKTGSTNQEWAIADGITHNGALQFYDATDTAVRMHIDGSGNIGINTTAPGSRKMRIVGSSSAYPLALDSTDTDYALEFQKNGVSEWWLKASASSFKIHENGSADHFTVNSGGNVGIGISPATSAGVNYARLVIDSDSNNYPKSLEINAVNPAGPNFAISSYSDGSGSYYLLGANLSYQTNGNFAWETNGENMAGISLDSRAGHGVTFIDSYYDGSSAYVPAEIGKVHTSTDSRADMIVDATGLAGDGGVNANAFFNAKAKGNYYAGTRIHSNSGHVGGWIGHWNGSSTARALQARVGGNGINSSDYQAIYVDYLGRVTHPSRPHFRVRGFPSHRYVNVIQGAEDGRLRDWNTVDINRGSHFTNSTGKFTIPVTGDYAFYCTVMYTNPNTQDFHLTFKLNGATLTASNDHNGGGSGQGHQWNGTTLCYSGYFSANDYVGYSITGGGSTSTTYLYQSNTYNVMGGYLL